MIQCGYFKDIVCPSPNDTCRGCDMFIRYQREQCDKEEGKKFDDDKPRWDLLPLEPIKELVQVLTFGAQKYGPENWRKVENGFHRYYAAAMRHLIAYATGELNDPETGLSHIAHTMCNLVFMHELQEWS